MSSVSMRRGAVPEHTFRDLAAAVRVAGPRQGALVPGGAPTARRPARPAHRNGAVPDARSAPDHLLV